MKELDMKDLFEMAKVIQQVKKVWYSRKAYNWLRTPNPLLGDITPREACLRGEIAKVEELVKSLQRGNG